MVLYGLQQPSYVLASVSCLIPERQHLNSYCKGDMYKLRKIVTLCVHMEARGWLLQCHS